MTTVKGISQHRKRPKSKTKRRLEKIQLKPSQSEAFTELLGERFAILNAPTGWGKSLVLSCVCGADLAQDPKRKIVIAIPQTIIAKGFVKTIEVDLPNGTHLCWEVGHTLYGDATDKAESLAEFLTTDPASTAISSRVAVVTHRTLGNTFASMPADQIQQAIADTRFAIDEGHHVLVSEEMANQIGKVVGCILNSDDESAKLLLATAFFFRGDEAKIVPDDHLSRFLRHTVPFDSYWESLEHLEDYRYDFVTFRGTVWGEVRKLVEADQTATIFYCPPEGHDMLLGKSKHQFADSLISIICDYYDAEVWRPNVPTNRNARYIVDFVDTEHRWEKIQFVMEHGELVDCILTVGMFREGADWPQAQRVIDLVPTGSDQDRNQRFGRLIRDFPGKKEVVYYSFFPKITSSNDDEQRQQLSKLFAHFHTSLILDNALAPIRIPKPDQKEGQSDGERSNSRINLLGQYDEQEQERILHSCHRTLVELADEHDGRPPHHAVHQALCNSLEKQGVPNEDCAPLAKQIVLLLRRRANINFPVDDLLDAGFDKVWADDALEPVRLFSAGVGGPERFRELRRAMGSVLEARWLDWYEQMKELPHPPPYSSRAWWWINNNKTAYHEGKLPQEKFELLDQISWWEWRTTEQDRWMEKYERVKRLEKPPKYGGRGRAGGLYQWCTKQRLKDSQGKLSQEQINLLEDIEWWSWNTKTDKWQERYEWLVQLGRMPKSSKRSGEVRLYDWCIEQKRRYRRGLLEPERIEALGRLPFWEW